MILTFAVLALVCVFLLVLATIGGAKEILETPGTSTGGRGDRDNVKAAQLLESFRLSSRLRHSFRLVTEVHEKRLEKSQESVAIMRGSETGPDRFQADVADSNQNGINKFLSVPSEFEDNAQEVAVLFADLVGSASYKYGHKVIEGIAKSYKHNMDATEIIEQAQFDGVVVKFMGDGLMAYFEGDDSAERAVKASLAIIEHFDEYNEKCQPEDKCIRTKIGVHHGPVWMMQFKEANRFDPQGSTVDLAARLQSAAPEMHVVVTDQVFEAVGGSSAYSEHEGPHKYALKGINAPMELISITTDERSAQRIPLPGGLSPIADDLRSALRTAESNWHRTRDNVEAVAAFRWIVSQYEQSFDANYRLAELLMLHYDNSGERLAARLDEATACLRRAAAICPQSSNLWQLLSWVCYQRFLRGEDKHAEEHLADAIRYANHGHDLAEGYKDEFGSASFKISLVIYLNERIRAGFGNADEDRSRAAWYVFEAKRTLDQGQDWLKSNLDLGEAMTMIAREDPDTDRIRELLKNALAMNPLSSRAAAVYAEFMNG